MYGRDVTRAALGCRNPGAAFSLGERRFMIEIIITPQGAGGFMACLGERIILKSSRQPLLDAARVLLAEGVQPDAGSSMRHAGATHVALSSTVGKAAKLEVKDDIDGPRFVPFYERRQGPAKQLAHAF